MGTPDSLPTKGIACGHKVLPPSIPVQFEPPKEDNRLTKYNLSFTRNSLYTCIIHFRRKIRIIIVHDSHVYVIVQEAS